MQVNITFATEAITLNFDSFAPVLKLGKKHYLIVRDNNVEISHITLPSGTQLSPSVIPNWIPVSFFEIPKDEIENDVKVYDTFKDNIDCKLYQSDGEEKTEIVNLDLDYRKIAKIKYCPRFMLYKIPFVEFEKNTFIVDESDKLVAIEYGKDKDNNFKYFLPVYLIRKAFSNPRILSLRFDDNPIKINKKKIKDDCIFHRQLNINVKVDTFLLMEGMIDKEMKVNYKDRSNMLSFYEIEQMEDVFLTKEIKENSLGKMHFAYLVQNYT
jgi:hypothetical protein